MNIVVDIVVNIVVDIVVNIVVNIVVDIVGSIGVHIAVDIVVDILVDIAVDIVVNIVVDIVVNIVVDIVVNIVVDIVIDIVVNILYGPSSIIDVHQTLCKLNGLYLGYHVRNNFSDVIIPKRKSWGLILEDWQRSLHRTMLSMFYQNFRTSLGTNSTL